MKRAFAAAVTLALAALLLTLAFHAWPPPDNDAPSFLVSAINVARGRGLVNPFYPQLAFSDPTGGQRHVHYPPLFPLVVAALMPAPTPRGAFLAVALLRCVSLPLAATALWRVTARAGRMGWPEVLLVCVSLSGLCTSWLPTLGRPEALATLLVLLAALAALHLEGGALLAALGGILGLTAATQPVAAVELSAVAGLYCAMRWPARAALRALAVLGLAAAAVFALVLAASPHGLRETVAGMLRAYPHTPWTAPPGADWWKPWLLFRRATFYGPLMLAGVACGAHLMRRFRRRPSAPALFAASSLVLAACVYYGSLTHKSLRNYNAVLLAPLSFGLVAAWFAAAGAWKGRWVPWARAAAFACALATTVGIVGHAATLPWYLARGRTLEQARADWARLALPPQRRILVLAGTLWTLAEDYDRIDIDPRTLEVPGRPLPMLVLGQRREHQGRPPAMPGFILVRDLFNPALPASGLPGLFVEEDYSFAVYAPE